MPFRLQRYNLEGKYEKGFLMYIAGTLNHAYVDESMSAEEVKSLEVVNHLLKEASLDQVGISL